MACGSPAQWVAVNFLNTFVLDGAGADIRGTADAFRFAFRRVIDDAQIVARVVNQTSTHPFAKAGVMLRVSVDPASGRRSNPRMAATGSRSGRSLRGSCRVICLPASPSRATTPRS
jgi:hypothetical protein